MLLNFLEVKNVNHKWVTIGHTVAGNEYVSWDRSLHGSPGLVLHVKWLLYMMLRLHI